MGIEDLTEERFLDIMAEKLQLEKSQITMDTRLDDKELAIESLDFIETIAEMEEEYDIRFPEDSDTIQTIRQIYDYIKQYSPQ